MESGIGPNVKMFRQMANMTQMDLAKALGYKNQASIARIENGERDIPLSVVSKMAEFKENDRQICPSLRRGFKTDSDSARGYCIGF